MVDSEVGIDFAKLNPDYISNILIIVLDGGFRLFLSQFHQNLSVWKCQITLTNGTFEFLNTYYF